MNNYEEENPPSYSMDEILDKIRQFDNNMKNEDIKFIYHGSYNVYLLKDKFILKVPDKILIQMFREEFIFNEVNKLHFLKKKLSFPIPDPIFTSEIPSDPFFVYESLPGVSLSKVFKTIPEQYKHRLALNIGKIVSEIHSLGKNYRNLYTSLNLSLNFNQYLDSINMLLNRSRKKVYKLLSQQEINWIETLFEEFNVSINKSVFEFVTTHNDFDSSNILVNPNNQYEITGIIDFEEFGLGDPTVDLLFQDEGLNFHKAVLNNYSGNKDDGFRFRIDFHKKKACLYYILTGLDYSLPKMVEYGKKMLQRRMKRYNYD